jgi:peptidoglycan-associated lipoprotein
MALGVNALNIEIVSYGEENPVADGHDDSAWRLNRRVEIRYDR